MVAKMEGNADYVKKHWKSLGTWADYSSREGFEPVKQLCTDDFASIKILYIKDPIKYLQFLDIAWAFFKAVFVENFISFLRL